jgi:hypothetical protein
MGKGIEWRLVGVQARGLMGSFERRKPRGRGWVKAERKLATTTTGKAGIPEHWELIFGR